MKENGERERTCRLFVILKDLSGFLAIALLFPALTLHVALFKFLKYAVGSPGACEDLVGILGVEEDYAHRHTKVHQLHVALSEVIFIYSYFIDIAYSAYYINITIVLDHFFNMSLD